MNDKPRWSAAEMAGAGALLLVVVWLVLSVWPGQARAWTPPTDAERVLVEQALTCYRARAHNRDPFLLLELLRLEARPDIGTPASWRGTILTVACHESGFSPSAIGDNGLALGLTQLHYYHRIGDNACNLDTDVPRSQVRDPARVPDSLHPIGNALCWLFRVRQAADHFERRGCRTPWASGWGWIATGRRCCGCRSERHVKMFRRWRRDLAGPAPLVSMPHRATWGSDLPI